MLYQHFYRRTILYDTSQCLPLCCFPLLLEWPLLDSRDPDTEGPEQNRQPDGLQSGGNAASGSQGQQLCTAQHPQTSTGAPALPQLVHGHAVGCAESRDFPEEGEDCPSVMTLWILKGAACSAVVPVNHEDITVGPRKGKGEGYIVAKRNGL